MCIYHCQTGVKKNLQWQKQCVLIQIRRKYRHSSFFCSTLYDKNDAFLKSWRNFLKKTESSIPIWSTLESQKNKAHVGFQGLIQRATESESEAGLYHAFWNCEYIQKSQGIKGFYLVRYFDVVEASFAEATRSLPRFRSNFFGNLLIR